MVLLEEKEVSNVGEYLSGNYTNSQVNQIISEWVHNDLDAEILRMALIQGKTQEEIAREVDRSVSLVQRHLSKYLQTVSSKLN